jgi:predicted ATPase
MVSRPRSRADALDPRAAPWRARLAGTFVGRGRAIAALEARFDDARLVTIIGPGGVGKTRVALEFALAQSAMFEGPDAGGVYFVDLTDAASSTEALAALCAGVGLIVDPRTNEDELLSVLARHVANLGPCLVVLDNAEHVLRSIEWVVSRLLAAAPSARLLVTSRVVLGVAGESELALEPLDVEHAITLLVDRIKAVRAPAERELSPGILRSIVGSIDRMPLAIELAASRTRVLSTEELARRLERPLEVLQRASGDARHSSVRRAVLDSVALLEDGASRLFALLSTLRNGFSLEAAEASIHDALGDLDALTAIESLVRASLLRVDFGEGEARYSFFATIREAADELRSKDPAADRVRRAHASHYAAVARAARAARRSGLALIARELDNMLAAATTFESLVRALDERDAAEPLAEIALAVDPVLSRRGLATLREQLLSSALTALERDDTRAALVTEALLARGAARRDRGDSDGAAHDFNAALSLATARSLAALEAVASMRLAWVDDVRGATGAARARLERALSLLERAEPGDLRTASEAEALLQLAHALRREGALEEARSKTDAARDRCRALDDAEGLCASLYESGVIEMFRGDDRGAFECFDQGLEVARSAGILLMEAACLTARGCLLQDLGRVTEALSHHAEAASIFRSLGSRYREASALYYLATSYLERAEIDEAARLLVDAKARIAGVGAARYDVLMHGTTALAMASCGRWADCDAEVTRAERALEIATREPALGDFLTIHRGTIAILRGQAPALTIDDARLAVRSHPTDDTRFALRQYERAASRSSGAAREPSAALRVWGEGAAFAVHDGARVELPAASPLRRILERLVKSREETPGEPVSVEALIRAGWPGERIRADAALNRLYVALATLRKRGLKDLLASGSGGYAISRAVLVHRVQD